jgi:hypothetical protein
VLTGEEVDARIASVPALLDWACIGGTTDERHPNYVEVTEGRDVAAGYSSCGDLAHWLLYRMGCRQEWVNRKEHRGWAVGKNISLLAFVAPLSCRRSPFPGIRAEPGDIFIQWDHPGGEDAHVFLCRRDQPLPGQMTVAEYGQPGGHIRDKYVSGRNGYLYSGRRIQRWLPLHLCITDAAERGELEAVSFPESFVPDTIPAPAPEMTDAED